MVCRGAGGGRLVGRQEKRLELEPLEGSPDSSGLFRYMNVI